VCDDADKQALKKIEKPGTNAGQVQAKGSHCYDAPTAHLH
jgi:hypothetical protein